MIGKIRVEKIWQVPGKVPFNLRSSFRRKPESSVFKPLRIAWTPVFTGVTTKKQILHTLPFSKGALNEELI